MGKFVSWLAGAGGLLFSTFGAYGPAVAQTPAEAEAWQATQGQGTVEAYQEFLRLYPASPFAAQAFRAVVESNLPAAGGPISVPGLRPSIEEPPGQAPGSVTPAAPAAPTTGVAGTAQPPALTEEEAWAVAQADGTSEGYREFLLLFPTSIYADQAFRAVVESNLPAAGPTVAELLSDVQEAQAARAPLNTGRDSDNDGLY